MEKRADHVGLILMQTGVVWDKIPIDLFIYSSRSIMKNVCVRHRVVLLGTVGPYFVPRYNADSDIMRLVVDHNFEMGIRAFRLR